MDVFKSIGLFSLFLLTQQLLPIPDSRSPANQEPLVKITVNLVQVDAVVTDSKGRHVTDLRAEDFEVLQDGVSQAITNLSYVRTQPSMRDAAVLVMPRQKGEPPSPPVRMRREQVARTIAIIVDDLWLSAESVPFVRRNLKKFVDEKMQAGDLVAVVRTSSGVGALQQFTSDKRLLEAAIGDIRWISWSFATFGRIAPLSDPMDLFDRANKLAGVTSNGVRGAGSGPQMLGQGNLSENFDSLLNDVHIVGTYGALVNVVKGLRDMPGRKSAIFLGEGIRLHMRGEALNRTNNFLNSLGDLANRSAVTLYAVDARELQTLQAAASDEGYIAASGLDRRMQSRREAFYDSQQGMRALAESTGGFLVTDTNDISLGIARVMDDQAGYYLIGYRPPEDTFRKGRDPLGYHKIAVRIKRPGLHVRSRQGFFGVPESETPQTPQGRENQLYAALTSPFTSGAVRLHLTSLFANGQSSGTVIRSFLHVDANDLTFAKEADGKLKAEVDILAVTYGEGGEPLDHLARTFSIGIDDDQYESALQQGFLYTLDVPVRKAGIYHLRAAVRDSSSERTGSASQLVEIPDLAKGALAISGIVLKLAAPPSEDDDSVAARSSHALRVFRRGRPLTYACQVYNARLDRNTRLPQVETLVRLFRDGKAIWADKPVPVNTATQSDLKRLAVGGLLSTGGALEAGEYALQVIARDRQAKEKESLASQWIDFEIVK